MEIGITLVPATDTSFLKSQFADSEIKFAIKWIRIIANLDLPTSKIEEENRTLVTRYTPLGVAVAIVPWNYPIFLATGKIAPCLVTGNTMIVKPSPFTPCGGLKLVELGQRFSSWCTSSVVRRR